MTNCDGCLKKNLWRNTGFRDKHGAIIRQCTNCGNFQAEPPPQGLNYPRSMLYYDLEISAMTIETFDLHVRNEYLSWQSIRQPPFLICWSAAWIKDNDINNIRVLSGMVTPWEARRRRDKRCLWELADLMNRADYLVAHNEKIDNKQAHTRFIFNRMPAPDLTVKHVDTLAIARKYFKNDANALEYWSLRLGGRPKKKVRPGDWDKCKAGDADALSRMKRYNKGDVREGIRVFLEFKKYVESGGGTLVKGI